MSRWHPASTLPEGVTALCRRGAVLVHAHRYGERWFESHGNREMAVPSEWLELL